MKIHDPCRLSPQHTKEKRNTELAELPEQETRVDWKWKWNWKWQEGVVRSDTYITCKVNKT
jgi:hypothetical protein